MRALRWICLVPVILLLVVPVASQTAVTPNAAFSSLASNTSAGAPADTDSATRVEAAPEQLGDQLMEEHSYQAALEAYQRVPFPVRSARLWDSMGIAYQLLSDFGDAVRCYKASVELDPRNPRFYNNLATAYDQLENHREAERFYREAIRLYPHSAVYLKNLGTNLLAQHEFAKGSEAYRQALAIDPHILDYHDNPSMGLPRRDNAESNYVRAGSCAQASLIDCTVIYLRKALDEGSATPKRIASDSRFQAVLNAPEVQGLLTEQR
jgi:tetratricopeptide (TPR) repeat protein